MQKKEYLKAKGEIPEILASKAFRLCFLAVCTFFFLVLRQTVQAFGISLGYLYILLISLAGFWFGLKGGIITAALSALIFIFEVKIHQEWPAGDLVLKGIPFRFIVYLLSGVITGYLSESQKRLSHKIEYLAYHDALTGCINYTWIIDFLEKEIARSRRLIKEFTIILIDIDYFKKINDKYGHLLGNDVLVAFADVIKNSVRSMDVVGRYGGEEFLIILPQLGADAAQVVLKRIKSRFLETKVTSGRLKQEINIPLRFSAGVASFPYNATTVKDLIKVADDVLYKAKREGRDRVVMERRRCIRLQPLKGFRVELARLSDREKIKIKKIDNISERGMLLLLPKDIKEEEVLCRISLSDQDFAPEFNCKIVHKSKAKGDLYRIGVYFVNLPTYIRGKLMHSSHLSES